MGEQSHFNGSNVKHTIVCFRRNVSCCSNAPPSGCDNVGGASSEAKSRPRLPPAVRVLPLTSALLVTAPAATGTVLPVRPRVVYRGRRVVVELVAWRRRAVCLVSAHDDARGHIGRVHNAPHVRLGHARRAQVLFVRALLAQPQLCLVRSLLLRRAHKGGVLALGPRPLLAPLTWMLRADVPLVVFAARGVFERTPRALARGCFAARGGSAARGAFAACIASALRARAGLPLTQPTVLLPYLELVR